MAYVPVPKDLTKVKTKVAFNLTKRQLVCFGGGALLGVPLFFLLRGSAGNCTAALCLMFVMLPFPRSPGPMMPEGNTTLAFSPSFAACSASAVAMALLFA